MKKGQIRFQQFLIIGCLLFNFSLRPLFAKEPIVLTSPITDEVGILNSHQLIKLQSVISEIENKTSAQVFLYIIQSLEGESLESYSLQVAEISKIGQKGKDNGVLVLLSVGDRKVRLEVGYGLEETLTDVLCNRIIRNIMIPEFKKGDLAGGVLLGFSAIESILLEKSQSNPNLQTDYPNGIGSAFSTDNTLRNIGIAIAVIVVALIVYFLLFEGKKYKQKIWLEVLYGGVVFLGLLCFLPDAVFYFFCFGLIALNLYLLYGIWEWFSYPLAILSLFFWIPFLRYTFHAEWIVLFWVFGIIDSILLVIKLALDEVLIEKFGKLAKKWGLSPSELFVHILAFFSFGFTLDSLLRHENFFYILYYQGLILFSLYGITISIFEKYAIRYGTAFLIWLFLVAGFFFFWPMKQGADNTIDFESLIFSFQWFVYLVLGFVLAKTIQVKSRKIRSLKYGLISFVWTFGFSIERILGITETFSISIFFVFYFIILLLHFFYTVWEESDGSSYSSSSSSSSYSSSSSSYRSSASSSSSSGGGGGSFGGGGSSGSW